MEKKVVLWIIIAVLAIAVLYITLFNGSGTGQVVQSTGQVVSQASSGMVGGC